MIRHLLRSSYAAVALLCAVLALALAVAWPVSYGTKFYVQRKLKPGHVTDRIDSHYLTLDSGRVTALTIYDDEPAPRAAPGWRWLTGPALPTPWHYSSWRNGSVRARLWWSCIGMEWEREQILRWSHHRLAVPCSYLVALLSLPPALWLRSGHRRRRARRRARAGLCPACGYDLRASPGRCPECGEPAPAELVGDPRSHAKGRP